MRLLKIRKFLRSKIEKMCPVSTLGTCLWVGTIRGKLQAALEIGGNLRKIEDKCEKKRDMISQMTPDKVVKKVFKKRQQWNDWSVNSIGSGVCPKMSPGELKQWLVRRCFLWIGVLLPLPPPFTGKRWQARHWGWQWRLSKKLLPHHSKQQLLARH